MDDRLRGVSPANAIIPRVSEWGGASLPGPEGPRIWQQDRIHSARQNVRLGPQVVPEQGRLKPVLTVQDQLAQAQRVQELTEPTLQLSVRRILGLMSPMGRCQ